MSKYVFIGWIVLLLAVAPAAHAQESKILSIPPVLQIAGDALIMPQNADYIGGMTEDTIGLDDNEYRFAPDVKFYSEDGQILSKSDFKTGEYVGYAVNDDGQVASLWKLKKNPFSK